MDSSIRRRLLDSNPWLADPSAWSAAVAAHLPERFVPRRIETSEFPGARKAKLIVGPRQTGKSTFLWNLLAEREPGRVLFLDCQEERVRAWGRSAVGMASDLRQELPGVNTLFFEEAQLLEEAGLLIKGLVDAAQELDIFVTGSSSYDLRSRTRESLAGRAVRRRLLPFSTRELLDWEGATVPAVQRVRRAEIATRQLVWGSYPAVWFHPRPEHELSDLLEAFVIRDASDRFRIQRPDAFRGLLELAAGQVGAMINLSEWASILGISVPTVSDYLALLEECWILKQVRPFVGGRRREITSARRVHFHDLGLRNAVLRAFHPDVSRRPDRGALLEGYVFSELVKTLPLLARLRYWRAKGGAEVDFVVTLGERILPVEVKGRDPGRVSRSLRSFLQAYEPAEAFVACGTIPEPREEVFAGTRVRFLPVDGVSSAVEEALGLGRELG